MNFSRVIAGTSIVVATFALVLSVTFAPLFAPQAQAGSGSVIKGFVGSTAAGLTTCGATYGIAQLVELLNSTKGVPIASSDQVWQSIKTNCLDPVAQQIAQQILKLMTQKTLDWVTTGMNGNPFYVRDLESYFGTVGDQSLRSFIDDLAQKQDNPYVKDIAKSLATNYLKTKTNYVPDFTLDKIVGSDWEEFSNGDFRKGGWDGWLAMTQLPQNNPVGSAFLASSAASAKIGSKIESNKQDLAQNNGFLSMKKCVSEKSSTSSLGEDDDDPALSALYDNSANTDTCERYETVTPGSAIADQLNVSINQGKTNLLNAKDLSDSLNSVFSALFNQLLDKGVTSLKSGSGSSNSTEYSGYGSNTLEETLVFGNGGQWSNISTSTDIDLTKLDEYLLIQNDMIASITAHNDRIKILVPLIYQADFCVPGPSSDWYEKAQENANSQGEALPETPNSTTGPYSTILSNWTGALINPFNSNIDGKGEMQQIMRRLLAGSNYLNSTTMMPGYKTWMEDRFNDNALLPIYPSINKEYKEIPTHNAVLKNNSEKITDYKSLINSLKYIKNQYSQLSPNQLDYDAKLQALQKSANTILVGLAKQSDIEKETDMAKEVDDKIAIMSDPLSGLIKECEVEFASVSGLPKERRPYPTNLLPTGFAGYPTTPSFFPTDGTYSIGDSNGKPHAIHITDFINLGVPPSGTNYYPDGSSTSFTNLENLLGIY